MTRHIPLLLLIAAAVLLTTTGFQCGSAEMTTARLAIQQKQYEKAEESLLKEVTKSANNEEAWFLLGQVRHELKKFPEMNEAFTKALAISQEHAADIQRYRLAVWGEHYNKGIEHYNKGTEDSTNYDAAIDDFSLAARILPDSASTYYVMALAYLAKNDDPSAIKQLETAIQRKPNYLEAARQLGRVHLRLANDKLGRGDSVGAAASFAEAERAFQNAHDIDPGDVENLFGLVEVYELSGKNDEALKVTREALENNPNDKLFLYAYGVFLLKQGNYEESIAQFKKVLDMDPENVDANYNCGVAYLNWGVALKAEWEKKSEEAARTKKQIKEDLTYKERFRSAVPYLEKSAESRADDIQLWQQLGRVYTHLNMVEKSKRAFDHVDRLMKNN